MIIRKPYAFLIKNFRKIHILLLIIGIYILYKTIDVSRFVYDFLKVGVYDYYENPIDRHLTWMMLFLSLLMFAGSFAILLVLRHKKKPWKTYLIPSVCYLLLYFVLKMIGGFFNSYTTIIDTTNLRLSNDLLFAFLVLQVPSLGVFLMRLLGIDIKKFNFNADLESLDFTDEDREEVEISINFDFDAVKRMFRKFLRYLGYFYKEHKMLCKFFISCFAIFLIYQSYLFIFVTHRVYRQGQLYNANGYTITINDSYITGKDSAGNVIHKGTRFVIVEVTVKNNSESRTLDTTNFHLKYGNRSFSTTEKTYQDEFYDLGTCYSAVKTIQKGEESTFILVYNIGKAVFKSRFVLYYQEKGGIYKLRKLKLKITNLDKKIKPVSLKTGDFFEINVRNKEDNVSFDSYSISDSITYRVDQCKSNGCVQESQTYQAPEGYKILTLNFASDAYEAKNMIDFLTKYGKIIYKDSKGKEATIDINVAVKKNYLGKVVFIKVPEDMDILQPVILKVVMRNQEYDYHLS